MENQEEKDGKACCSKKCCGGKALGVIALLLIGGAGGYFAGKHCKSCAVPAPVAAPVQPAK